MSHQTHVIVHDEGVGGTLLVEAHTYHRAIVPEMKCACDNVSGRGLMYLV